MTRCMGGHKTEAENREGIEQGSRLERSVSQLSRGSGNGSERTIWRVGKEVGLTELGHKFDGGRGLTPRQRDHMCKDIEI